MRFASLLLVLRIVIVAGLIGGPVVYAARHQKDMKNFRVVRPGVLYRSGQMTLSGFKRALHDYDFKTVVTLRDARTIGDEPPDAAEEKYCARLGINYVRIPPRPWEGPADSLAPVQVGVDRFVEVMNDPANYPVLVHCFAGTHRTGAYCAIYRMEFQGWSNEEALNELKATGYHNVGEEKDIFGYLSRYRPHSRGTLLR